MLFRCRLNWIQLPLTPPPHSLNFYNRMVFPPSFCLSLSSLCVAGRACVATRGDEEWGQLRRQQKSVGSFVVIYASYSPEWAHTCPRPAASPGLPGLRSAGLTCHIIISKSFLCPRPAASPGPPGLWSGGLTCHIIIQRYSPMRREVD
jgi:hypothetical protein